MRTDFKFSISKAGHGMQIFNLQQLLRANPGTTFSNTAHLSTFGSAHNVFVNEETEFAYVVGQGSCSGGLYMVDLSDPETPVSAGCFSRDGYTHGKSSDGCHSCSIFASTHCSSGNSSFILFYLTILRPLHLRIIVFVYCFTILYCVSIINMIDVQCVVYNGPDSDYQGKEICFASNEDTVTIVDVTDKTKPVQISRMGYNNDYYTHQGWLTEDHEYFIFNDELDERGRNVNTSTHIADVRDLKNPVYKGTHVGRTKAIDHNNVSSCARTCKNVSLFRLYKPVFRVHDIITFSPCTIHPLTSFFLTPPVHHR